jgi:trehalose-6-phosphate hydrolase
MTNPNFDAIDEYRDVESLNMFQILKNRGLEVPEILEILKQKSRDNSRTPVQWNDQENAGFTTGTPWIDTAANYKEINAEKAVQEQDSIFYHYQKLIQLRKEVDVITDGDFELILDQDPDLFAFIRTSGAEKVLVLNNFYGREKRFTLSSQLNLDEADSEMLISNYEDSPAHPSKEMVLRPYESIVYYLKN